MLPVYNYVNPQPFARKVIEGVGSHISRESVTNEASAMEILCKGTQKHLVEIFRHNDLRPNTGSYFIDMELCDIDLAQYIDIGYPYKHVNGLSDWSTVNSNSQVILIMEQVLNGLAFIHSHDKVHRDLKPQNSKIVHRN